MLENIDNKATRGSISQIILKALNLGDKYGYEICKDIERLSNGKLVLKQPSLYSCLRRMEEQKLISSYWKDSLLGGRRHYYSVTDKGKQLYEENKSIWKNDDELLRSLPDSDSSSKKEGKVNVDENLKVKDKTTEQAKKESTLYVLDQENLFNIARRKDEEIKRINPDIDGDDRHSSFLQFDFFEQNIKVVKKNNEKGKEDIQVFTNKFSDMDNHKQDIEPEENLLDEEQTNNTSRISLSSILDKEIKRENNSQINTNTLFSTPSHSSTKEEKQSSSGGSIFSYLKNSTNEKEKEETNFDKISDIINNTNDNFYNKELQHMQNEVDANMSSQGLKNISTPSNDLAEISWEKMEDADTPLFDHDYKSAIGKLYNNSQLKDPYEQNKFQTFKEIFPSSTLKEKEQTEIRQTKIDAVIQSSSDSNIDCDDIKLLNNLYNLQGLNIKIHNNNENKRQDKVYKDKNKLNMICAWIIVFVGFAEFFVSYSLLKNNNLFLNSQKIIYICSSILLLIIGLVFTMKNIFDRYKLVIIKKHYTKDFVVSLLVLILLIVGTFAINVALGMNSLSQVNYLSYWLIPCLLFSNLLLSQGIYAMLLKSKYFNS